MYFTRIFAVEWGMLGFQPFAGRIAALGAVLALTACATQEAPQPSQSSFAEPAAAEVISVALDNITDKYIEPVSLDSVGTEGLRGLASIDPAISLKVDDGHLILFNDGQEIARMQQPSAEDARAWGAALVALTETARGYSSELRNASSEKIYEAIFDGVLSHLDIFSRYAGNVEANRNRAKRDGFGGIGVRFRVEGGAAIVTRLIEDTPAAKSGLVLGDRIIAVEGHAVAQLDSVAVTELIRGPVHTHVNLVIDRPNSKKPFEVSVPRAHIVPQTVIVRREDGIGIVKITSFNQETAHGMEKAIAQLTAPNAPPISGIILDLRGNPGGLLRQSIKVADQLLTQGDILRTVGRHPDSLHHYTAGGTDLAAGLPVVVLVDGKSASAAEIVAAALQDRDRAVVIGTSSYGKGSVQTVIRLPNDGEITLTWSKFVAPSGYYLHGMGVVPTVCTSGHEKLSETTDIIQSALDGAGPGVEISWRHRAFLDDKGRSQLRSACPSETRRGPLDLEVAKRLIDDRKLHARALLVTAATAEVTN